jgi:hypothetical protein
LRVIIQVYEKKEEEGEGEEGVLERGKGDKERGGRGREEKTI